MKARVADFLARLEESSSPHTVRGYRQNLSVFVEWSAEQGVTNPSEITHRHLRGFLVALGDRDISRATIGRYLAAVRSFTRYLTREGDGFGILIGSIANGVT